MIFGDFGKMLMPANATREWGYKLIANVSELKCELEMLREENKWLRSLVEQKVRGDRQ